MVPLEVDDVDRLRARGPAVSTPADDVLLSLEKLKPSDIPSPPQSCLRIVRAASDEDFSFDNIAQMISADPAFTSEILRTVNTPHYANHGPVATVKRAVFILGWRIVRNIALSFSVRESLRSSQISPPCLQEFWRQAVLRATACKQLTVMLRRSDAEEAFTIGLLQDVGFLVLLHLRPTQAQQWQQLMEMSPGDRLAAERSLFGLTHVQVVSMLAERWGIPASLAEPIAHHHDDNVAQLSPSDLTSIAHAADLACAVYSCSDKAKALQDFEQCLQARGLKKESVEQVLAQVSEHAESAAAALGISIGTAPTYEQLLFAANETLMAIRDREEERAQQLQQLLREKEQLTRQLERTMSSLEEIAYLDPLTGLANRRRFDEVFLGQIERAQKEGLPLSLILVDIDHFKKVNDTWGHPCGDGALKAVAQTLMRSTRSTDHHARIGGEEMAMLLLGAATHVGKNVADKARQQIAAINLVYNGAAVPLTASFGGATLEPASHKTAGLAPDVIIGRLMKAADTALYAAKQSGRNRVCWATDSGLPTMTT
jgi:diguanylate cyclase (GGDEF)-like protein